MAVVRRSFRKCYRVLDDGTTVIIPKKDTIRIVFKDSALIIHRWWNVRGTYQKWKALRESLLRYRTALTPREVRSLAQRYGFEVVSARKRLPRGQGFEKVRYKNKKGEHGG